MYEGPPSLQNTASLEKGQVHDDQQSQDLGAAQCHEVDRRVSSSAGCENVVDDDDPVPWAYGIPVELQRRSPVLEFILAGVNESGQLALLSHRDEPGAEVVRKRSAVRKASRLDSDHGVHLQTGNPPSQSINDDTKGPSIRHDPAQVLEGYPGLWPILNHPDAGPNGSLTSGVHDSALTPTGSWRTLGLLPWRRAISASSISRGCRLGCRIASPARGDSRR